MAEDKIPSPRELQLLSLVIRERSGQEVARGFRRETGKPIAYGTLYSTLRRMKDSGWVQVRDGRDENDGRVRFFWATGTGARALARGELYYATLSLMARRGLQQGEA